MAVGNKVSVGKIGCGAGFESFPKKKGSVGVARDGWNGVGVGDAFGAEVIRTKGKGACVGAGVPHDEIRTAREAVNANRVDGFII